MNTATLLIDCRCTLGEGILWWPERRAMVWTDIERSTLWLYNIEDGSKRQWALPDRLGSFAICRSGRLLLGLAKKLAFAEFDGHALRTHDLVAIDAHLPRHRINDGRTDRAGNFVFGTYNEAQDAPTGSFYQYSARRGLRRLDLGGVVIPNSICFSLDGREMYFCDSPEGRIRRCDYDAESAAVSRVRDFVRFKKGDGLPDGSVIDSEGCLWNGVWGAGRVRRFGSGGELLSEVSVPAKNTTCVAFGGDALQHLYITTSRQEMTDDELRQTPSAGSVYFVATSARGVADAAFVDS